MPYFKFLCSMSLRLGPGQLIAVFGATFLASAFEILGVGMVYGFAGLVFSPESFASYAQLKTFLESIGLTSQSAVVLAVGMAIIVLFLIKAVVGFGAVALRIRFAGRLSAVFADDFMELYALQPYESLLGRHSSDFVKNVLSETFVLGAFVLTPFIGLITESILLVLMVSFLIWIDPVVTAAVMAFFAMGYCVVYLAVNPMMSRAGEKRVGLAGDRAKAAIEFFGGMREILLSGRWPTFLQKFSIANHAFTSQENRLRGLPSAPAFALQFLAVSGAIGAIVYYALLGQKAGETVASMTLFAAAGLRMMPSLNSLVRDLLALRGHWRTLIYLADEIWRMDQNRVSRQIADEPLRFEQSVALRNVTYRYPDASEPAIRTLTIEIPKGGSIGIVGATGAGKSTVVEILLGLLPPQEGYLEVDGEALPADKIGRWQRSVGYVPQQIYLADDTVTRNIAFGIPDAEIDPDAVRRAAGLAHIHDFIETELELGYDTMVGERGQRLSGGQLQRIGIARALYHSPEILILDEATSALDNAHEDLINQAVRSLAGKVTTVTIAHRLTTIRHCDRVYELERGMVR